MNPLVFSRFISDPSQPLYVRPYLIDGIWRSYIIPHRTSPPIIRPSARSLLVSIRLDVLRDPLETLLVTWSKATISIPYHLARQLPDPSENIPCLMTTEHMKISIGLIPSTGTLPFPVVWYNPKYCLSSSSEQAFGWSILLPKTQNGTFDKSSIASKASSSALASGIRSRSIASTRKMIPETSGKKLRQRRRARESCR